MTWRDLKSANAIEDIDPKYLDMVYSAKTYLKSKPYTYVKDGLLLLKENAPADIKEAWLETSKCTRAQVDYKRLTGEFLY